jgi:beta-lactam-binding protein with PASTA domain
MSSDGGVPNVVGLTQAAAVTALSNVGLSLGSVTQQSSETMPAGKVISQDPAAGTSVPNGSAVNIVVSTGPHQATVPDVVGLTESAATAAITGAGLTIGSITRQSSASVPAGHVIIQNPVAGTSVADGSAVNLVVSSGPPIDVPDVVGLEQTAAAAAIMGAELAVGTVMTQPHATVPADHVISQSPPAGSSVANGSSVNLVVSAGPAPVSVPNVVGLAQAAAETALTNAELGVGAVTEEFSSNVQSGRVISQSPTSGMSVPPGTAVNLVVSKGPKPVSVPNVVGLTQAAASSALANAELVLGDVTKQPSDTVPPGEVLSQDPAADTTVDAGSPVNLVVAKAPLVSVPDVVGSTQGAAVTALGDAGLVAGTVTQQLSDTVPAGSVVSQDPAAGTQVDPGAAVDLVVSKGAPVTVPDVVGATFEAAQASIVDATLLVGNVTQQPSSTVPSENVISQDPPAGTSVASAAAVDLVVSSGPAPATVPDVVGLDQGAAGAALANAGLAVGAVTQQSSASLPSGSVISQSPPAGTSVAAGSAVDLVVSTGPVMVVVPDVVGMTQAAAGTALSGAGLAVGTVTQQSSASVPAGSVISQSPIAGSNVAEGSAIGLVVSSGAAAASASVSPASLAFGNQAVNVASSGRTVTVSNAGGSVLPLTSITFAGSNPGQFSRSSNCPAQLAVGGTCTVNVFFKPTSTGNKSANLNIAFGGGAGSKTVVLTGTGVNFAFTVSPTSLAFGKLARGATSAAKTVTVKNTGTVALPIASVALAGNAPSQYTRTHNCPSQLSTGSTCTVQVRFKPTSTGSKPATLVIAPGGGASSKSVTLSGTGT